MTDYYPYGTDMTGRSYTAEAYRYGYQGSEKDNGLAGGTGYTTFFRSLDPRIGRWQTPDPKVFPWQSPYCSMDCNPVALVDPWGAAAEGGEGDPPTVEGGEIEGATAYGKKPTPSSVSNEPTTFDPGALKPMPQAIPQKVNLAPQKGSYMYFVIWGNNFGDSQEDFSKAVELHKQLIREEEGKRRQAEYERKKQAANEWNKVQNPLYLMHQLLPTSSIQPITELVQDEEYELAIIFGALSLMEVKALTGVKPNSLIDPNDLIRTERGQSWKITTRKVADIMKSAKNEGIKEAVEVFTHKGNTYIINGHHRVIAAQRLGIGVPIIQLDEAGLAKYGHSISSVIQDAYTANQLGFKVDGRMLKSILKN